MYSVKPKKATRNLFHFSQNTNNDNNIIVTFIKKEKETIIVIALRAIACSKWCGRHTTPFHRNLSVAEWCTVVWLVLRTFFLRRWTCFSWSDKSVFIHYWRQTRLTTNKYESIAAQKLKVNLKINIYMSMWWIFLFRFVGSLNVLFNFRILNMFAIYSISLFVCLFVCCTVHTSNKRGVILQWWLIFDDNRISFSFFPRSLLFPAMSACFNINKNEWQIVYFETNRKICWRIKCFFLSDFLRLNGNYGKFKWNAEVVFR